MTALHERRSLFAERNLFVHAVLGVIVTSHKVRGFIERHVLARPDETATFVAVLEHETDTTPPAVYAVLGTLSLMRTLDSIVEGWLREGTGARSPGPTKRSGGTGRPGDLLR